MNTNKQEKNIKIKKMVYPFYTITQLSNIFGMTRLGTRNLLMRMNLPYHYIGNKIIFYLSDIQTHQPELFSSILEANQLNKMLQDRSQEDLQDNDFTSKDSFR